MGNADMTNMVRGFSYSLELVAFPVVASAKRARRGSVEAVLNCEWCLDKYNHQGWYGECFVQVLAAAAGLPGKPAHPRYGSRQGVPAR